MKKLQIKAFELGVVEVLSRDQMKKVLGGEKLSTSKSGASCITDLDCQLSTGYHYCCLGGIPSGGTNIGATCLPCN